MWNQQSTGSDGGNGCSIGKKNGWISAMGPSGNKGLRWINIPQLDNGECRGGLTAICSMKGDVEVDERPPAEQNEVKVDLWPLA